MTPKISVIVPVYKVEQYLPRCVDSILKQTFRDFELILVDDGSPDHCGAMCEEYAAGDGRIHVIHRENGGLSAARNTGIEWMLANSSSAYLTFIDSDDWIHPQYLEILLHAMEVSGAQVSMVGREYTDTDRIGYTHYAQPPEPVLYGGEALFLSREWDFNYAWGKLYRREHFRSLRYPEGKNFEDVFTTYQVLFTVRQIALVDEALYFYFRNESGISHSPWNPGELVILEGMRQQMAFYQEHGFPRAYEKEHRLYLNHYAYHLNRIRQNKADLPANRPYIRQLRKEMLRIIRRSNGKYTRQNMPQCYAAAYPRWTEVRRLCLAAMATLKRSGLSGVLHKITEVVKR